MTDCITYKRFSTKAQDKGSSYDRQGEAIDAMVKAREWTVVEQLEDLGRSAWRGDHLRSGELGRFKQRVDAGEVNPGTVLVIENIDRLSRQNVKKARRWIEEVTEAGVNVAVANKNKVFTEASLSGENIIELLEYLLEAKRSNEESEVKSGRISKAWRKAETKAAETGRVITSKVPAWLYVDADRTICVDEQRAAIVRRIYELSAKGMGYMSIAKTLNEEGVKPWGDQNRAALWEWSYVRNVLRHPAVEGEYHAGRKVGQPTGMVIENYYPRVVPEELVAQARSASLGRSRSGGSNYRNPANLFAGLMKCRHCGSNMLRRPSRSLSHERAGKQASYLQCYDAKRGGPCGHKAFFRYEHFEREALDLILGLAVSNQYAKRNDETATLVSQLAQARKKLENKQAEQRRLLAFIMANDEAPEATAMLNLLRPEVADSQDRVRELEKQLEAARGGISQEQHVERVLAVSNALASDDEQVRAAARLATREAIASVVDVIFCQDDDVVAGQEMRTLTVVMAGQLAGFKLNNEGNYLGGWSMAGEMSRDAITGPALRAAVTANAATRTVGQVAAIAQRDTVRVGSIRAAGR